MCAYSRIDNGEVILHTVGQRKVSYKNRHHFSKETLAEIYSSHILPLGSPLKESLCTNNHNACL